MANLVGHQLGNYRFMRLLGKGGFADVYLGEHIHLNTLAAIKVLQTRLEGSGIEQFRNEARLIAHLKHPNIVPILDFNVQEDIPFLVMEYATNGTLRQHCMHRLPLPPAEVLLYMRQVASALQYAHDQHLIHRDVKPENMLLGTNNEVLLSDFGLALITESIHALAKSSASTVDASGTIYYMAPEQIQGHPTAASDQYALGIVLYEWLTGRRPFSGSTYVNIAMQHISTPPAPIRSIVPAIPREVEDVVYRALAKDPQQRFPNVMMFANTFEQACRVTPIASPISMAPPISMIPPTVSQADSTVRASGPQAMEAVLQGPSGSIALGMNTVSIGRDLSNQFVLNDPLVSGRHALIRPNNQGYAIIDMGSANGTSVNGQKLAPNMPYVLHQGDAIGVGNSRLNFEMRTSGSMAGLSFSQQPTEMAGMPATPNASYGMPSMPPPPPPPGLQPLHLPQTNPPSFDVGTYVAAPTPVGAIPSYNGVTSEFNYSPVGPINQPPPMPSSASSRKGLWIALSVVAALLVIAGAGGGVFAYVNSISTPAKTLDSFCTAIQTGNDAAAYGLLSSSYQKEVSRPDFESFYGKANACTHTAPVTNGNAAQANWTLSFSGQNSTVHGDLNQDSSGTWKITDDTQLFGLVKTLDAYCTALQGGDHTTAYEQFSINLQNNLSSDLFGSIFPQVNTCNHSGIALTTKGAAATLTTVNSMGQSQTSTVTMMQDSNNTWKFDDFGSLPGKTMSTFCTSLQQKDYQTAYNQFSTNLQSGLSESQFTDVIKPFTSCASNTITVANSHVTTTTNLGISGYNAPFTTYLVQDNTGTWKIDTFFNPPYQTMTNFCNAMDQKDYQTAYNQFGPGLQAAITEPAFATGFANATGCTATFPQQNGTSATSTVTFHTGDGRTVMATASLIQTGDGTWKIDDLKSA